MTIPRPLRSVSNAGSDFNSGQLRNRHTLTLGVSTSLRPGAARARSESLRYEVTLVRKAERKGVVRKKVNRPRGPCRGY